MGTEGSRPLDDEALDLGCGEGAYAIEAAVHGADVLAIDARRQRMDEGAAVAARHGLRNVRFAQEDVRRVTRATHGEFDVVLLLGLLHHLDAPVAVLEHLRELCRSALLVDTLVSLAPDAEIAWRDRAYRGHWHREHADDDPPEARRSKVLKSIDNTFSFRLSREALVRANPIGNCNAGPGSEGTGGTRLSGGAGGEAPPGRRRGGPRGAP